MLVHVGSGITQGAERVHHAERLLAAALQAAVNALRFIDDDDGARRTDQVDGRFAARLLAILVEVVHVLLVDRAHGDDHDLNRSEEHTSELQSLMRISYAVFCLKNKTHSTTRHLSTTKQTT